MPLQLIQSTDKLQSGFRAKANSNTNLIITGFTDNGDGTVTVALYGGTSLTLTLTTSFYTKAQVLALIALITPTDVAPISEIIVVAADGSLTINWQTDLVPSGVVTYAAKFGETPFKFQGWIGTTALSSYTPNVIINTVSGSITTVVFNDIFIGFINIGQ